MNGFGGMYGGDEEEIIGIHVKKSRLTIGIKLRENYFVAQDQVQYHK